tara:strand:+ start:1095 stop:1445 length:351 start_codon:yes stop_codon:yes gene_type:complete
VELVSDDLGTKVAYATGSLEVLVDRALDRIFCSLGGGAGEELLVILDTILEEPEDAKPANFRHEAYLELLKLGLLCTEGGYITTRSLIGVKELKKAALKSQVLMEQVRLEMRPTKD